MTAGFYSLELLILAHISERYSPPGTFDFCDRAFLNALAWENNQ